VLPAHGVSFVSVVDDTVSTLVLLDRLEPLRCPEMVGDAGSKDQKASGRVPGQKWRTAS
jgi:hypothetical protein